MTVTNASDLTAISDKHFIIYRRVCLYTLEKRKLNSFLKIAAARPAYFDNNNITLIIHFPFFYFNIRTSPMVKAWRFYFWFHKSARSDL